MELASKYIKRFWYNYLATRYLLAQERSYKSKAGIYIKIKCITRGFSSEKYDLYNLSVNGFNDYLSDFKRFKTVLINRPYQIVLNDKNVFSKILAVDHITPEIYGKLKDGRIYLEHEEVTLDTLKAFLKEKKKVIIKKYDGGGGKGVYRVVYSLEKFNVNNDLLSWEEFINYIKNLDNYLIMEHLEQARYANTIYSGTINCIRIITMKDPETGEIFIPIAVHKFGSKKTEPADNVWRGGLTAQVDIETGILKKSALHHCKNKKIEWVEQHPDTKVKIEGTRIPNWDQVKRQVIEIARSLDFLNYVGWDVVVTDDGIKIIEGNNFSDVNILQIHQPLLIDERAKSFYRYHKIIK